MKKEKYQDQKNEEGTELHQAVFTNNLDAAKILLEKGANPNELYKGSITPLIAAMESGHWAMAEILIRYNADVKQKDAMNNAPLSKAILYFSGDTRLIELLLLKGADARQELTPGYTPLHLAQSMGLESMLLELINKTKR